MRQTLPNLCWLRDSERRGFSDVAIRPEQWSLAPSDSEPSFYAPDFDLTRPAPWLVGERVSWPAADEFTAKPRVVHRDEPAAAPFFKWHQEILGGIAGGQFKKVVPWTSENLEFESELSWQQFPEAFQPWPERFNYGFQLEAEGLCGLTPEILFRVENGRLETVALAGTSATGGPSLLDDRKELLEHQLVIEHLAEVLSPLGRLSIGHTNEVPYGILKHLRTPLSVELRDSPQFMDLIHRLHPTAALGGWPRTAALESLRQQGGERGHFGAPFGYVDGDRMLCVVAIRGLEWCGRNARLMSGCGVVEGSQADREWRELALKRRSVAEMLGLQP